GGGSASAAGATRAAPAGVGRVVAREQARVVGPALVEAAAHVAAARAGEHDEGEEREQRDSAGHGGRPPGPEGTRAGNEPMSDPSEVPRSPFRVPARCTPAGVSQLPTREVCAAPGPGQP